jgi:hypothetical protein
VQRINADPSLLGGMRIEYVYVDAGFTVVAGNDAMSKLLAMKGIDAVFGPGEPIPFWALCRFACLRCGRPAHSRGSNVVQQSTRLASQRCGTMPLPSLHPPDRTMAGGVQGLVTVEQNLFQQTYACTAPLLSDTGMYPTVRGRFASACVRYPALTDVGEVWRSVGA